MVAALPPASLRLGGIRRMKFSGSWGAGSPEEISEDHVGKQCWGNHFEVLAGSWSYPKLLRDINFHVPDSGKIVEFSQAASGITQVVTI
jgi:hypothetical protein